MNYLGISLIYVALCTALIFAMIYDYHLVVALLIIFIFIYDPKPELRIIKKIDKQEVVK